MSGRSVYAAANASENKEAALTADFEGTVLEEASEDTCTTVTGRLKIYFSYLDEVGETMQIKRVRMGDYVFDGDVKMELPLTACDGVEIASGLPPRRNPLGLKGRNLYRILMETTGAMESQARLPNPGEGNRAPNMSENPQPKAYDPQEGYEFQILCRNQSYDRAWEHCDYAVDRADKKHLLSNYREAYGAGWEFKTIMLPAKYWPKTSAAARAPNPGPATTTGASLVNKLKF